MLPLSLKYDNFAHTSDDYYLRHVPLHGLSVQLLEVDAALPCRFCSYVETAKDAILAMKTNEIQIKQRGKIVYADECVKSLVLGETLTVN